MAFSDKVRHSVIRYAVIWLIALPLAFISAMAALGTVSQSRAPAISLSLFPINGFAYGTTVNQLLQQKVLKRKGEMPDAYEAREVALARSGFATEPTDTKSIMLLALAAESEGDLAQARALMQAASQLSRRNDLVNLWLFQDYDKLGQLDNALANYDYSLRSSSRVRDVLITSMTNAMTRPEFIEPLASILDNNPPWAKFFWSQLATVKPALSNTALMRQQLHEKGIDNPAGNDSLILRRMIVEGKFAEAVRLFESLSGRQEKAGKERITNGGFDKTTEFPPFDWEFISAGGFAAAHNMPGKSLDISVLSNASGLVARQFLSLEPGQYILSAQTQGGPAADNVAMRITCAEAKQSALIELPISKGGSGQPFSVSSGNCRYFWFEILVQPSIDPDGYDLAVSRVSVTKN